MGRFDKFVDITQTSRDRNNWRMVTEELKERTRAVMRGTAFAAAQAAYEEVLGSIPNTGEYRELRSSLKISEIGGVPKDDGGAFAVHVPTRGRRISKVDVGRTVIYVRAKKRLRKNRKDITYLEDHGPWTADTIPFWPSYKEAVVVQRKVSKREADAVAKSQERVALKVRRELNGLGKKVASKKKNAEGGVKRNQRKAVPDVAMQALNLEFGLEGSRARPVFRTALRRVKQRAKNFGGEHPALREALTDPNSQKWKTWPKRHDKISSSRANEFAGFHKRLGYS